VYIHVKTLGWLRRGSRRPLTLRRALMLAFIAVLYVILIALLQTGRALDHLLFPGFRRTPVGKPVFIIATPRSGTTLLHHLLALDEETFTHFRLYQTVFPTVLVNRVVDLFAAVERVTRVPFSSLVKAVNARMFTNWEGIHDVGLDAEEEDEAVWTLSLVSPSTYMLFPSVDGIPELRNIDARGPGVRARLAHTYRTTVQRHLYTHAARPDGAMRTMLIKTVLVPNRLEMAQEAFPEARFVRVVRDPRRAIPSAMSLLYATWKAHSPEIARTDPETRGLATLFLEHYRRLCLFAREAPPERCLTVFFEDLVDNPMTEVERIYAFLGLEISAVQRARLVDKLGRINTFKSEHDYSLEDFGLTEADILEPLRDVLPALGYDQRETRVAGASCD
jgi:hypothetical protein